MKRWGAFGFVLTMGIVNLFGDWTYEGGASINGPFLRSLGASAAAVGILAGLGEFLGYSLRAVSGYVADRTGKYWPVTFVGYAINTLAVPAMALTGSWHSAGALVLAERVGRAIRKPTVEAMLSYSTAQHGRGWVYAVNSALDETGATLGPLFVALVLLLGGDYRRAYALLLISTLLVFVSLVVARSIFPVPARLERQPGSTAATTGFSRTYWIYMVGAACFGAGLMSFEFISYHLSVRGSFTETRIPLLLAFATAIGVIASLALGRWYDRRGLPVLLAAVLVGSLFSPLVFLGGSFAILAGLALWGIGYAVQDTLLKAVVAGMLPEGRRNLAFGLFYSGYGFGWLAGSTLTGLLLHYSVPLVITFSVAVQLASLPLFILAERSRSAGQTV
ncbi:MAG TPA: MFS transporter [Candidatus Polarisedimenticolaceae bacterium]|nr:MFS transporter [Candidatus Polarisedimenticolaceae bacterium]